MVKKQSVLVIISQALFFIVLALTIFLRFYRLGDVPPALNGDEAVFGSGALQILNSGPAVYVKGQGGAGVLSSYLVAFFFLLFEPGKMALRFQASFFGVLTVPLLYLVVKTVPWDEDKRKTEVLAVLAALVFATSYAYVNINRIAFALVHLSFFELLLLWLFWLGYRKKKSVYFLLAGLALALLMYGYIAGLVMVGLIFGFFVLEWGVSKIFTHSTDQISSRQLLILAGTFIVGILPLIVFYVGHQNQGSSARMGEASFLNPIINQGDPLGALWRGVSGNYAAFGLQPIQWFIERQFTQFITNPLPLLTFIGIIIAAIRIKQTPYRFLLLWWGITILPAALAPDKIPHASRAIGVFAPLAVLTAMPVVELIVNFERSLRRLRRNHFSVAQLTRTIVTVGVLLWIFGVSGRQLWRQYDYYFNQWPYTAATLADFDDYANRLANDMASLAEPDAAFILLRNTAAGSISPNGSVNFFYQLTQSPSPHYWVSNNETTVPEELTAIAQNQKRIYVVDWKITKHNHADPKQVFDYYLQKNGSLTAKYSFPEYTITAYDLPTADTDFSLNERLLPAQISFGEKLTLTGYTFGEGDENQTVAYAGGMIWTRLRWEKTAEHPEPLKVSLILKDAARNQITAIDKFLQNNILHRYSTEWAIGDVEDTYFTFLLPADLIPGNYSLSILVYGADSMSPVRVSPGNQQLYSLGHLQVLPASTVAPFTDEKLVSVGTLERGLTLYTNDDLLPSDISPGSQFVFETLWHTTVPLKNDYTVALMLQSTDGRIPLGEKKLIGGDEYPTSNWRAGETLRQRFNITIPPGTNGAVRLEADIQRPNNQSVARWAITAFKVNDWSHVFSLPSSVERLNARFGQSLILAGYGLTTPIEPGKLALSLYWQTNTVLSKNYTMFVHLIDATTGQVVSQIDRIPTGGTKPMTGWLPGEIISDTVTLSFPPEIDPLSLQLSVGLYSTDDFQRLPVLYDGVTDDKLLLSIR